jgi:hypothetical protein
MRTPVFHLAVLTLVAAGCTTVFDSDFETEATGAAPLYDRPGPPAGDTITGSDGAGAITVTGSTLGGARMLQVRGPAPSGEEPVVYMNAAPISRLDQPVYLTWQGMIDPGAIVDVNVLAGFDDTILRLRFDGLDFVVNSLTEGSYQTTTPHRVLVSLWPDGTYRISGSGGVMLPGTLTGELENADAFPAAHVSLEVILREGESFTDYWIDDVWMSHREPQ